MEDYIMRQIHIEQRYSSKGFKLLLEELLTQLDSSITDKITSLILEYLQGSYYESKNLRIEEIKTHSIDDIIYYVFISVFTRGQTTLQNTSTALGLYFHNNKLDAFKSGCELLSKLDGILFSITRKNRETFMIEPISLPKYILDEILLYRYLPPMIESPLDWTNNYSGGYLSTRHCAILGDKENKVNDSVNYSVLNKLQSVAYTLSSLRNVNDEEKKLVDSSFYAFRKELLTQYIDKPMYFVWQYDKRGRAYSHGYHLNIQADEYGKSLLEFYNRKPLTKRGIYWLKISIANHYGLDKETWKVRENWVTKNISKIISDLDSYCDKADEPFMFRKAIEAWIDGVIHKKPIGYIAQFDATTSGVQIASALMKDRQGLKYSNLVGHRTRYDFYSLVANRILELVPKSTLFKGMTPNEIRKFVKPSIMTYYYNSQANPKETFGEDTPELKAFYKTLKTLAKGADEFMELGNRSWDNNLDVNYWELPDGHVSYCPVMETVKKRVSIDELKGQVTFMFNQQQASERRFRSLVPNLVHSYDAWVLREVISKSKFDVAPIHDCFGIHPNDVDEVRRLYRHAIADIVENVEELELNERTITLPKANLRLANEIRNNEKGYYLC